MNLLHLSPERVPLATRPEWKEQTVSSQAALILLALQPLFAAILFICEILRNAP